MKRLLVLAFLSIGISCSKNDDSVEEATCLEKDFQEVFTAQPGDCFVFDNPVMTFTLVSFAPFDKADISNTPNALTRASIQIDDLTWEIPFPIYKNPDASSTSFSGFVTSGINDNLYTIYLDAIEFIETETHYEFHSAVMRLERFVE